MSPRFRLSPPAFPSSLPAHSALLPHPASPLPSLPIPLIFPHSTLISPFHFSHHLPHSPLFSSPPTSRSPLTDSSSPSNLLSFYFDLLSHPPHSLLRFPPPPIPAPPSPHIPTAPLIAPLLHSPLICSLPPSSLPSSAHLSIPTHPPLPLTHPQSPIISTLAHPSYSPHATLILLPLSPRSTNLPLIFPTLTRYCSPALRLSHAPPGPRLLSTLSLAPCDFVSPVSLCKEARRLFLLHCPSLPSTSLYLSYSEIPISLPN
ncbi:unnamed protein product [Closterium sp. Naga37s-1]|nr:unnamed protein product [Closterium sp. Naga37s-1]